MVRRSRFSYLRYVRLRSHSFAACQARGHPRRRRSSRALVVAQVVGTSMLASGPWYDSGTLWAAASALMGLLGAIAVLVTWLIGTPRRILICNIPASTSLLTAPSHRLGLATSGLEVTYRGKALSDPYLVVLKVESRSRRDIRSRDFDQGKPLIFDIGAPIRAVVGGWGAIGSRIEEVLKIDGSQIKLEPVLIRRGKVLHLNLLAEGSPNLSFQSPLIDVTVKQGDPDAVPYRALVMGWLGVVYATFGLGVFIAALNARPKYPSKTSYIAIGAFAGLVFGLGLVALLLALTWRQRQKSI